MKAQNTRAALAALLAGAAACFHQLLGPLIVLAAVMIADYATGMAAAWAAGALSSRTGLAGILKKVGYLFAVAVAVAVDYILHTAALGPGAAPGGVHIFGLLVTVWLILNECISILENLSELGVPVPGFLRAAAARLKQSAEEAGARDVEDAVPCNAPADPAAPSQPRCGDSSPGGGAEKED